VINVYVPLKWSPMKPSFAALLAAGCAAGRGLAQAQMVPPAAISVTGEATISVPPGSGADRWRRYFPTPRPRREASDANNAAMGKVLLALKGAGLDEKDFQTLAAIAAAAIRAEIAPVPRPLSAIRASNRVTVRLRDVHQDRGHD